MTPDDVADMVTRLGATGSGLSDVDRVELLRRLDELKAAAAGLQAVVTADLDTSTRAAEAAAGVSKRSQGAGVAAQVGLARRESVHRAAQHLNLAKALMAEMPHMLAALRAGRISEWRATLVHRETSCLTAAHRAAIDEALCANPATSAGWGDRRLAEEARKLAYAADPHAVVARARKAESERYVSTRPAPDTMVRLHALLPVTDGVAAYAALHRAAETARCEGDPRSRGQVMADTLVARLTGRPAAGTDAPVGGSARGNRSVAGAGRTDLVVNLVITDRTLLAGDDEPAVLDGYGVVPAGWSRELVTDALTGPATKTRVFVRRLYTAPGSGKLVAMDSRRRHAPNGLAALIRLRDAGRCRIPYCDAPAAHIDHLKRHADGGETSETDLAEVCAAHNYAKEASGFTAAPDRPEPDPPDTHPRRRQRPPQRHTFTLTTPTGHSYTSVAPAPPGTAA